MRKSIFSFLSLGLFLALLIPVYAVDFGTLFFPSGSKMMGKSAEEIAKLLQPVVLQNNEKSTDKKNSQKITQLRYDSKIKPPAKPKNPKDKANGNSGTKETDTTLTLGKRKITEGIFFFNDKGNLERIKLVIYGEGDNGEKSQESFDSLQKKIRAYLDSKVPSNVEGKKSSVKLAGATDNSVTSQIRWKCPRYDLALVWSKAVKAKRYLEIEIGKPGTIKSAAKNLEASRSAPTQLRKNIIKKGSQVHVQVPMINQGDKGYCVSATIARLMQYYGVKAEMNQLSQLFDSDKDKGTNLNTMLAVCKKNEDRLHLRVKKEEMLAIDLLEIAKKYNARAKKDKTVVLPLSRISKLASSAKTEKREELKALMGDMTVETFVEVFKSKKPGRYVLTSLVQKEIDKGRPVLWSVMIVNGKGPLEFHLRIINGYDSRKRKIVYTDSWGGGKEAELMDEDEAWAITTGLFCASPIK